MILLSLKSDMQSSSIQSGKLTLESFKRNNVVRDIKRPFGNIPRRRSYLIICEGEQTEPNYFLSLKKCLPRRMVENIVVDGAGGSPDYLLKRAQEVVDARKRCGLPQFYNIWLVFDKDDFEHFEDTIIAVESKNKEGVRKNARACLSEHWHCAWSNEAFEIWYVLHFREQLGGGVSREKYKRMIEEDVRKYTGDSSYRYLKNDSSMFNRLHPYVRDAVCRAERGLAKQMKEHGNDWSAMNPATTVYVLVRELLAYLQKGSV